MHIQEKSDNKSNQRPKITVTNSYLQKRQQRFALIHHTFLISFVGLIIAIGFAGHLEVGKVEIGLLVGMYSLTSVGITVGVHRYFTHKTFKTNLVIKIILAILGSMAAEDTLIKWVSDHRRHHQYTEQPGDTHSPHIYKGQKFAFVRGLWYSQIGWIFKGELTNSALFAKDILQDPVIFKVNQLYLLWVIIGLAIPTFLGGVFYGSLKGAWQGFLWGGIIRIFLKNHMVLALNSIGHLYGSRPFNTPDKSTNNIWLVIPTLGEGWHNNHHAFPNSAKSGLEWWQLDPGYWIIRFMEVLGLVWDVKYPTVEMIKAKKAKT
ncbi:MAG: acyl-CoA desaturase [Cyanobacteria bacterium P01_D01_bin.50]